MEQTEDEFKYIIDCEVCELETSVGVLEDVRPRFCPMCGSDAENAELVAGDD